MSRYFLTAIIGVCIVVNMTISIPAYGQLLMWNKLENEINVQNSEVGPGFELTSYIFSDWQEAQIAPTKFGNGLFDNDDTGEGWTNDGGNFFATNVNDMGLSLTQGCVEFWFEFKYDSSFHNTAYFFGTRNALTDHFPDENSTTNGYINMGWNGWDYDTYGKRFFASIGNASDASAVDIYTPDYSAAPGGELEFFDGTAFHFAMIWDLNGINGTADTLRLYVNGKVEASSTEQWTANNGFDPYLYLGSWPNYSPSWDHYYNSVKGVTDNFVVWDYAKTSFSQFRESPLAHLSMPTIYAMPGETVTVPIEIDDAQAIAGADITVHYDDTILIVDSVDLATLTTGMNLVTNTSTPGEILMSLADTAAIPSGSGALINIVFTVDPNAAQGSGSPITFHDAEIYDEMGATIPCSTSNGEISVPAMGDISGNGDVESNDALLAMRYVVGLETFTEFQELVADVSADGRIRTNDAILILRIAVGLPLQAPGMYMFEGSDRGYTLMLTDAQGAVGERITVPLTVDNIAGLAGGDIDITYNASVLRAVGVSSSDSGALMASNTSTPGEVRIALASLGNLSNGKLAEIQFDVLADDASTLKLQTADLYRSDGGPIASDLVRRYISNMRVKHTVLHQNYPNPFNPETWIPYQLRDKSEVTIRIYNTAGTLIRELNMGHQSSGSYVSKDRAAYWDGANSAGEQVSSGIYFYSIQAQDYSATRKMIVQK